VSGPTVSLTFDNLGEAAELERGTWPEGQPLGEHFSVRESLPAIVRLLERHGQPATFFVEGVNGELYADELAELRASGHEVAAHGWRHEPWHGVDDERGRLARTFDALGGPAGFRPPGGRLNPGTPALLRELGYRYCSPAGSLAGRLDGVGVLPFRWELIDAYAYVPHFGALRQRRGDPEAPMPPAALRDRVLAALDAHAAGHLVLLFHPFLLSMGDEAVAALEDVLERAAAFRCVRMDEAAAALPEDGGAPALDDTSWDA
jgi:peptidoglycan/xylan/chitin deacetylase (PgdA/CDA1 family)